MTEWDEADHPRQPKGTPEGGQWVATGRADHSGGVSQASTPDETNGIAHRAPTEDMLELAHAWWQTTGALLNAPFEIKQLQSRIASEIALAHGAGKYAHLHMLNVPQLQQKLEELQKLVPQLEKQKRDLEQRYHDAGYDDIPYSSWTTGEMRVGGKGIEEVGRAVGMGGSPAGLQPTGIEFDIASAVLAWPAILRLGKAVLGKAIRKVPSKLAGTVDDFVGTLPRSSTPKTTAAGQYEIKHTGPYNYTISGGGAKFDIDGHQGTKILEAKHVGDVKSSPYVPGSSCYEPVRSKALNDVRDELRRVRTIIHSGETPFKSIEIITNTPESKALFEGMLKESGVPGTVRLAI